MRKKVVRERLSRQSAWQSVKQPAGTDRWYPRQPFTAKISPPTFSLTSTTTRIPHEWQQPDLCVNTLVKLRPHFASGQGCIYGVS